MRSIPAAPAAAELEAPPETAVPPHAERPDAATANATLPSPAAPSRARRARRSRRLVGLTLAVGALGLLGTACDVTPGPHAASSAPVAATPPGTPPLEHWYALAQCETGGRWDAPGPTYVGGLGMYAPNWAANGGLQYAPSADLATPEQQIAVATNLWLAGGSWGCKIGDGWDNR